MSPDNPFTRMQKLEYAKESAKWSPTDRDPVVGSWDAHEAWTDYDLLFAGLDTGGMVALDFGCGPGRMMLRYGDRFRRIDGADIDETNLGNARARLGLNSKLFLTDGVSLTGIPSAHYDLVFSVITLQHIPVRSIRYNLLQEFFRVLKPGGVFTAQTGFGETDDYRGTPYPEDRWDAPLTNGACDVIVPRWEDLRDDLHSVGFWGTQHEVRPAGPNDWHPNWIFFRAFKKG